MRVGIYFCSCGGNITERIDPEVVREALEREEGFAYFRKVDFLCSGEGKNLLRDDVAEKRPDRVVIAACSPRDYERAFRQALSEGGMNPYLMQMVNIREQVAWVTTDPKEATQKACRCLRAAMARACRQEPLETQELPVRPDVVVIGAGPAGLKATLALAASGRKVTLVEKTPVLGGLPVRYEELYPGMECGPCLLEPILASVLHGPHARNIELLPQAEVTAVKGFQGNFDVQIRQRPRYVSIETCIGCAECIAPCPATAGNEFNYGLDQRKAIAFPFAGALPNVPFLDWNACVRSTGGDCNACQAACPVEGAIDFEAKDQVLERQVGAIVLAVGAGIADGPAVTALGYGSNPDVVQSLEFERILAANGPTGGEIRTRDGRAPERVAIVHCVGSMEEGGVPYCSGVCCGAALKFSHLVAKKLPQAEIIHLYKEIVMPGKDDYALWRHARENERTRFVRYVDGTLSTAQGKNTSAIRYSTPEGKAGEVSADFVVLCPAIVPNASAGELSEILEVPLDRFGFFEELHARVDTAQSRVKGIYLAGTCQSPQDIQKSMGQGSAAAGGILSALAAGRTLEVDPATSWVDEERCSGCRTCGTVCPYKAIAYVAVETVGAGTASGERGGEAGGNGNGHAPADHERARVNAVLCQGCGTCAAACPAGAIRAHHFTNEQISAEIEAVLR